MHFAYPNVLPRSKKFIGCGRYTVFADNEEIAAEYSEACETPNTPNRTTLKRAAQLLAAESFDSSLLIYHKKDRPEETYQGDSLDLAWFLAHVMRSAKADHQVTGDIWCTGVIQINGTPHLFDVDPHGFALKLEAFLNHNNKDRLFIVPLANITPQIRSLCRDELVDIIRLTNKTSLGKSTLRKKTILAVPADDLATLIKLLFPTKHKLRTIKGYKAVLYLLPLALIIALGLVAQQYLTVRTEKQKTLTQPEEVNSARWLRRAYDPNYNENTQALKHDAISDQANLGYMYESGIGVKRNFKEAVKWYSKAAKQGHAGAQTNLGLMYRDGSGVKKSYKKAVKWFSKAAEQNNPRGQVSLGYMYENGLGVRKDFKKAVKWYRKAAEQGNNDGQANLGIMYQKGLGVEKNGEEAVNWLQKAARQGNPRGQANLGYMYENGVEVKKDFKEAARLYRKAAEQGNSYGQVNLGLMYKNGTGVEKDDKEAAKWLHKAAQQGNPEGQVNLGYMFEHGLGVRKNYGEAVKWYRKAAEQGHAAAQTNLGLMYKKGLGVEKNDEEATKWLQKAEQHSG